MEIVKRKRTGPVIFSGYEPGSALKKAINMRRDDILFELRASKLKGRGGAGFPISTKWMLTAAALSDGKYVICNADEGEPGTFKDRVLLIEYPELVFEGMIIGGYTTGAREGIVYLRGEYEYLLKSLEDYLGKMRADNFLGKNILGKEGFNFDIRIFLGEGAYVCGEETALIESLEGHRGEARNRPPYPVNTGYNDKPTAVNNVETLATVPHIILNGADWFNKFGTKKSSGTKLISVSGDCSEPGVYEVDLSATINEILKLVKAADTKAVQVGGASGVCLNKTQFDRTICYDDASTGGSIIVLNESRNMLKVLKNFMEFFVEESCGQCTPCRMGNVKLLEGIEAIERNDFTFRQINKLINLAQTMQIASKCGLGQSSPKPFLSILENFKDEVLNFRNGGEDE